MEWLRRKVAVWLDVDFDLKMIAAQQKMLNQLETAVHHMRIEIAESAKVDPNLRTDIAVFEQRLDALCAVCGVEVVITNGEVITEEISPAAADRCEEAAAMYELAKEISSTYERLSKAEVRLSKSRR